MKTFITWLVIICIIGFGIYFITKDKSATESTNNVVEQNMVATSTVTDAPYKDGDKDIIGRSASGNEILAYHYGSGETEIVFVGGLHGGYEWNTVLVAQQLSDYLKKNPTEVSSNLKVTVIPVVNPDGLEKVVGTTTGNFTAKDVSSSRDTVVSGRFNGNNVDLNRNFDCDWKSEGKWQNKTVSGGASAFSESESQAVRDYILAKNPKAVVVWYSSAGGVFASSCHNGVSAETKSIMNVFAKASGYPAHDDFNFYEITGDMVNWLAKQEIPAISVLLTNHTDTEWSKNLAGIKALLKHYTK
jgi:hypothetical protein